MEVSMGVDYNRKTYAKIGEVVLMELSFSEVCMHMQVAGTVLEVRLQHPRNLRDEECPEGNPVAQIFKEGKEYSAPIGTGEAGFYQDEGGYYYYAVGTGQLPMPEWAKYDRVDEVIECYPITDATQRALLEAMPDAYGGEAPGEDDWPEPDSSRDAPYKLSKIWEKLSSEVQQDLLSAYQREWGDRG